MLISKLTMSILKATTPIPFIVVHLQISRLWQTTHSLNLFPMRVRRYYYGTELLKVEAGVEESRDRAVVIGWRFVFGAFGNRADVVRNPKIS